MISAVCRLVSDAYSRTVSPVTGLTDLKGMEKQIKVLRCNGLLQAALQMPFGKVAAGDGFVECAFVPAKLGSSFGFEVAHNH